jgi:hypothetical protein
MRAIVLCILLAALSADAATLQWRGMAGTNPVTVTGQLLRGGTYLRGQWRCRGKGCLITAGQIRLSCSFGGPSGYVGRCQIALGTGGPCMPGAQYMNTRLFCGTRMTTLRLGRVR